MGVFINRDNVSGQLLASFLNGNNIIEVASPTGFEPVSKT